MGVESKSTTLVPDHIANMKKLIQLLTLLFPLTSLAQLHPNRALLLSPMTLFVATTGSDSNPGTNISSPLLTIQAAVNKATQFDFSTNNIMVQIANGVYSGSVLVQKQMGNTDWKDTQGMLIIHGNDASPTSVTITNASTNHLFLAQGGARVSVRSLTLGTISPINADLIDCQIHSLVNISNIVMGPCGASAGQLVAEVGGDIWFSGPYTVTGGGLAHYLVQSGGTVWITAAVTVTGTPTYTLAFAQAYAGGALLLVSGGSISGSATGPKYQIMRGGSFTSFGGASPDATFPGSVNGIQDLQLAEGSAQPFTATNGVYGAINASSAAAGVIGEFMSSIVPFASRITLSSNTTATVTSFTLTPGDWDLSGEATVSDIGSVIVDASAANIVAQAVVNLGTDGVIVFSGVTNSIGGDSMTVPRVRINTPTNCLASLVIRMRFSGAAPGAYGTLSARRMR